MEDEIVFRALADPSRRRLLDLLFERDGRTLSALESELPMTRFGVMKHLRVLQEAGLIATRKVGRERLHYLNPVPIQLISDRWINKYMDHQQHEDAAGDRRADASGVLNLREDT
ncbi:MAG: helix-turn-helix transcriptional regulator [Kouleothrix sp.]|nr:helix-turn-helix transcriptional regulator [Kouleothrix sp.]